MARILVVANDRSLQLLLYAILTRTGHDVLLRSNGPSGMDACSLYVPDLTIVDWDLGDMYGYDLLTYLTQVHPHAPVIILTCEPLHDDAAKSRLSDELRLVNKGTPLIELARLVQTLTCGTAARAA